MDDGTPPNNAPGQSTGGSVSATWSYGVPGGWVINYDGGLADGSLYLANYVVSPEIAWDLPGPEDDAARGLILHGTIWHHLPFLGGYNGVWRWWIRSYSAQEGWSSWTNDGFGRFDDTRAYREFSVELSTYLQPDTERFQIRLGVEDWELIAVYFYGLPPTTNGTPSPIFDNITLKKYTVAGPTIGSWATIGDAFPANGALAGPVRFDPLNGERMDGTMASIETVVPGMALADPIGGGLMRVAHLANPVFAAERADGLSEVGAVQVDVDDRGWPIYEYAVTGVVDPSEPNEFTFDLPDGPARPWIPEDVDETALIFSGDRLHFYIEAQDDQGGISTLPADTSGFLDFGPLSPYDPGATMRALPSWDGTESPSLLLWNAARFGNGESATLRAMAELGFVEGRDYDLYTRNSWSLPGLPQIEDYNSIVYIQPGSAYPPSSSDLQLLTDWHFQLAERFHAYLGSQSLYQMSTVGSSGPGFLGQVLGLDVLGRDVASVTGGHKVPFVIPDPSVSSAFASEFVAYGAACPVSRTMEWIEPVTPGARPAHVFGDGDQTPFQPQVAASILWAREENGFQKTTIAFPFDLSDVRQDIEGGPSSISARAVLLGEILALAGRPSGPSITDSPPTPLGFESLPNQPNPFNPSTSIRFHAPTNGKLSFRIYDVQGALVREVERVVGPGWGELTWDGRDGRGRAVASGIYYYQVSGWGETTRGKMALLK